MGTKNIFEVHTVFWVVGGNEFVHMNDFDGTCLELKVENWIGFEGLGI